MMAHLGSLPIQVHVALRKLAYPMNAPRSTGYVAGMEVAAAYNYLVKQGMDVRDHHGKPFNFFLSIEHDNIPPQDGLLRLFDTIELCPDCGWLCTEPTEDHCPSGHKLYDAVSGLYFIKSDPPIPMAFGDPANGPDDFGPRSISEAAQNGLVLEVNGVPQGFTLYRRTLFEKLSEPWFQTISGEDDAGSHTQDLYMCRKAKEELGARFAVNCAVKVGHIDIKTGVIY